MAASLVGGVVVLAAPPTAAATGAVAGVVFEDYDADGAMDVGVNTPGSASATDVGVAGAAVSVTDSTGTVVATTVTDAAGAFSLPAVNAATTAVRVVITPPGTYVAGPHGPDSDSTVQFVTLGSPDATDVEVGLVHVGDYSPASPVLLDAVSSSAIDSGANLVNQSAVPSLISSDHGDRGTTAPTVEATAAQAGSVWGLTQLDARWAFTAAVFKRHAFVGPGGLGAVYLTDTAAGPNATPWVTIPDAGTNPRGDQSTLVGISPTVPDWFNDVTAFAPVGRIGLGGMAMAPDHRSLYVVNLNSASLWQVPFTLDGTGTPVAGTPVEIALPLALPGATTGCAVANLRPFGVSAQLGALWVPLTCTGPATADLRGYVYRYDLGTGTFGSTPAFELSLTGYSRGSTLTGSVAAAFQPWEDLTVPPVIGFGTGKPQAVLSDVTFDSNGDMNIGIKDRYGDQAGPWMGNLNPASSASFESYPAGDVLRACLVGGAFVLESNGSCGSRVGALAGNNQGPGGGEFYFDNFGTSPQHHQTMLGALLQLPGFGQVVATAFDPLTTAHTQGIRFSSNLNGSAPAANAHQLIGPGNLGSFRKAGGLGDVAALVVGAPIEIGNRVWIDADIDGVQDAGEVAVGGATVRLYAADGTTLLATAVTDAAGTYWFSNGAGTSTPSSVYGIGGLRSFSDYVVRVDNPADFAAGGPLAGQLLTVAAAGPDRRVDSNGVAGGGGFATALVTTGPDGSNDHTIDFGFRRPPAYSACRGSGLRLGSLTLAVANEPIVLCVSVDPAFPSGLNFGSLPLPGAVGGLLGALLPSGSIGFNADGLHAVSYNEGPDRMRADADVVRAAISLPGVNLAINTIRAEASATLLPGCTTALAGVSRIGSVSLNGLPLVAGTTAPVTIPLGIATLYLNQRVATATTVTYRAVFLDLPGTATDLILGEAIAGIAC